MSDRERIIFDLSMYLWQRIACLNPVEYSFKYRLMAELEYTIAYLSSKEVLWVRAILFLCLLLVVLLV